MINQCVSHEYVANLCDHLSGLEERRLGPDLLRERCQNCVEGV